MIETHKDRLGHHWRRREQWILQSFSLVCPGHQLAEYAGGSS